MKRIVTVLGEISPEELGVALPHEHVICDISRHSGTEDNLLNDVEAAASEVAAFKRAGGGTIVDVTTEDIGRDPVALKRVAEISGIHIITAVGLYAEKTYPEELRDRTVSELAEHMIREANHGIGDTGIKPGIIGELGALEFEVSPAEEKVLRAAARTHNETGPAITLHSSFTRPAPNQVAILREEGVSLSKVIVSHADIVWHENINEDLAYFLPLLDAGCYLGFDTIGWQEFSPEPERIKRIMLLLDRGYEKQLLLSSDLCRRSFYHANRGRGYDYVLRHFIPKLREQGVSEAKVNVMLKDNPREVLSF